MLKRLWEYFFGKKPTPPLNQPVRPTAFNREVPPATRPGILRNEKVSNPEERRRNYPTVSDRERRQEQEFRRRASDDANDAMNYAIQQQNMVQPPTMETPYSYEQPIYPPDYNTSTPEPVQPSPPPAPSYEDYTPSPPPPPSPSYDYTPSPPPPPPSYDPSPSPSSYDSGSSSYSSSSYDSGSSGGGSWD